MRRSDDTLPVTCLLAGTARGVVLKLTEPLNAWGGLDADSGVIVHHSHPQRGQCVAGRVLVMPQTRGSGTNAQVFAQAWANTCALVPDPRVCGITSTRPATHCPRCGWL